MASADFDIVTARQFRASDEIYIRDVPISQIVSSYRITMAPGGGSSLLQGGVASADGASTVTPIVFRRLIQGANVTFTETADGLEIAASVGGGGVASLTNQGLGIPIVYNASGILKTLQAGANMSITEPTPGVLLFTAAMSGGGSGVLSLSNAGATGFSLIAGPTPSTTGQLKTISAVANHRLYITEAANVLAIGLQLLSTGTGFSVVRDPMGTFNSLVPGAGINIVNDGIGNLTISQALTSTGVSTGTFLTATSQAGTFPQARQLLGTANQIVLTDNGAGNNMTVGFPTTAPPQTGFDPTVGNHLVRLSYLNDRLSGIQTLGLFSMALEIASKDSGDDFTPVASVGYNRIGTGMNGVGAPPDSHIVFTGGPNIVYAMTVSGLMRLGNSPVTMYGGYKFLTNAGTVTKFANGTASPGLDFEVTISQPGSENFVDSVSISATFTFTCTAGAQLEPRYFLNSTVGQVVYGRDNPLRWPMIHITAYSSI